MNGNTENLIYLLSKAIRGQKAENSFVKPSDWSFIYKEAREHQVHTLLFPILSSLPIDKQPDSGLLSLWQRETLLDASEQIFHMEETRKVFIKFNSENIPVIALKGLILRNYYPSPELRTMGDADILVYKSDLLKAKKLLVSLGYKEAETDIKHTVFKKGEFPAIELHWVLTTKEVNENNFSFTAHVWEHATETCYCGTPFLALSTEDQIIHLLLHAASHMLSGGFGLRQLCDIVLFAEKQKQVIDWESLLNQTSVYDINKFTMALLTLCKTYFNLEIPNLLTISQEESYINILLQDIINAGVYGRRTLTRETSDRIRKYIDVTHSSCKLFDFTNVIRFSLPPGHKLNYHYSYVKRYPFLLPFAWIHRAFHNLNRLYSLRFPLDKSIEAAGRERSKLLHWLQLR